MSKKTKLDNSYLQLAMIKRNGIVDLKNQIQVLEGYIYGLKNPSQQQETPNETYS